ncbi:UDP-N-acetylmuramoyl-tripeptide--D-alanyl-D-alanine ligase [Geobacillus sp. E263]|uniref:UDP-N-acetylmuramoyl-tripeptide--D-alanyl-D- alanine ligase n=1 Tax=Geobacillus sp. E263 TaxID=391290 RepID=UPI00117AE924|nr:UDP-N-acetylmuramoyl-tripeptide--D-alanyl-D-alanine ligase [Geobacillus sp. E263]
MKWLYLNEIVAQIGGSLVQGTGNPLIKNVVTKRYKVDNHTLLIDLYTKRKIRSKLFQKYKPIVVVTEKPQDFNHLGDDVIVIKVEDVDEAYWKFIDYYRSLFDIPIIGVTGTCGKTTTKEMIKHILEKRYKVQATYKSFNGGHRNHRYLLGIDETTGAAVIEMGVDSPGDITFYIKYFRPQIRILLNIDVYHLVGCKTPERYLEAKAEILHDLDPVNGTLILNADDENIKKIDVSKFRNIILYFGFSDGCDFQATDVAYDRGGMRFTLRHQNQTYPVFVPGYGKHNVYNALAAIAAVWSAEVDIKEACERLASFNQVIEHLEFHSGLGGCTVIDDTWNVTPLSMANALQVMKEIAGSKTKIALLGYMPQLGDGEYARQEYAKMGEKVIETQVDFLIVVGDEAKEIGRKALELGMDPSNVYFCRSGTEIYQILKPFLNQDSVVLLKIPHRIMVQDSFQKLKQAIMP